MTLADLEMLVEHWKESPSVADCVRALAGVRPGAEAKSGQPPAKTDLTQAEYDETLAAMRGNAEAYGRRRN